MKAVVFTLGCKVNECESDSLMSGLKQRGYEVSDRLEFAELYIVNTCAVTNEAEKKSRQMVARINKLNPNAKVIFTGCACQNNPQAFTKKSSSFLVTGTFSKNKILDMLDMAGERLSCEDSEFEELLPVTSLKARAFVKVQDGCNNFCSYCLIPYLRGRNRSRNPESVLSEINSLHAEEIVINGINLSAYEYNGEGLTGLIKRLNGVETRIRLGSLEVNVINEELLEALMGLKDFAPHFHLSLQSGSNNVLKKMNRHYSAEEYLTKVELIRKYFPNAGITTDIIVGFPTETKEDFIETLDFVDKVRFSDIHPFPFSARKGTVASKMQDIDHAEKKRRLDIMLEKKAQLKNEFIQKNIGSIQTCLIEEYKDGFYQGYTENYIRVFVKKPVAIGAKVKIRLTESTSVGAIGEIYKRR